MGHFLHFHPPKNPKIRILQKCKKFQDIIILHMCTKKHDHMRYSSWDMEMIFLSFWAIYCPFTPLITWQIKIWKKQKKYLEMSSVYTFVPKIMIIWCMLPEIWSETDNFLSFWAIFALLPHYWPQKLKFEKKYNKRLTNDITLLHTCTIYEDHMMYCSWDMRHYRHIFLLFWAILVLWPS